MSNRQYGEPDVGVFAIKNEISHYEMIEADNAGVPVEKRGRLYCVGSESTGCLFADSDIERVRAFLLGYAAGRAHD